MRPFTLAVFEREGKALVESRWTLDQVNQAYKKADNLLDFVSEYKDFEHVREMGLDKIHSGFEGGLKFHVSKNMPDKSLQSLSLHALRRLLDCGEEVMRFAVWSYKNTPDIFKAQYASSKQAYLKDRILFRNAPVYSFSPFDTGDNPAITRDMRLSQVCADLYCNSDLEAYSKNRIIPNYIFWRRSPAGDKFFNETVWLRRVSYDVDPKRVDRSIPIIESQMQYTHC